MHGIRIKDKKISGANSSLSFDLRDILRVLLPQLHQVVQWKVRFVEFTGTVDIASSKLVAPVGGKLGQFRIEHKSWSNKELKEFADLILWTFDGEFEGYKKTPKGKRVYIRIVAFDTSWWDVFSPDEKVLTAIKDGFHETQFIESKVSTSKVTNETA